MKLGKFCKEKNLNSKSLFSLQEFVLMIRNILAKRMCINFLRHFQFVDS